MNRENGSRTRSTAPAKTSRAPNVDVVSPIWNALTFMASLTPKAPMAPAPAMPRPETTAQAFAGRLGTAAAISYPGGGAPPGSWGGTVGTAEAGAPEPGTPARPTA